MDSTSSAREAATDSSKVSSAASADWSRLLGGKARIWRQIRSRQLPANPPCRDECSDAGNSGGRDWEGFQEERPCVAVTGALQLMSPSRHGQPRPEVPRCPPCQESAALSLRQFGDALQVHLDADSERRLDFLVGRTIDRNVQIGADPVPTTAGTVCITPQCRHGLCIEVGNGSTRITIIYHFPVSRRRQALGRGDCCDSQHGVGIWLMA